MPLISVSFSYTPLTRQTNASSPACRQQRSVPGHCHSDLLSIDGRHHHRPAYRLDRSSTIDGLPIFRHVTRSIGARNYRILRLCQQDSWVSAHLLRLPGNFLDNRCVCHWICVPSRNSLSTSPRPNNWLGSRFIEPFQSHVRFLHPDHAQWASQVGRQNGIIVSRPFLRSTCRVHV
jgi:hypothetical protein